MIKHLRIDNRLIHGQVVNLWLRQINVKSVTVVNDAVANDAILKKALVLAAPNIPVHAFSIEEAVRYARDNPDEPLFYIAKYPTDALRVLESGVQVEFVNVGNAAPIVGKKHKMVTNQIAVSIEDAEVYRQIAKLNNNVLISQLIPSYSAIDFLEALRKAGL